MTVVNVAARRFRALITLLVCGLVLIACGPLANESDQAPTTGTTQPPAAGELSVGDVLSPLAMAWKSVGNERVTTQWGNNLTAATPSPSPSPPGQESVAITIAPESRYLVNRLGGVTMDEVIAIDGVIYARGPRMTKVIAPHADPETWVRVDPATLPREEPVRYFLINQQQPPQAPFANLDKETLAQPATDIGEIDVHGRACHAYTFTEETPDMGQWTIEVSLDVETGLPCRLVRTMDGTYQAVSIFEYNVPDLELARPATWIPASPIGRTTPVVGPLGLPSTGPLSTPVPATPVATPSARGQMSIH